MPPETETLAARRVSLILHKFSRGGSDRVAAYLARGFADQGMGVDLVVFCQGGEVESILTPLVGSDIAIQYLGGTARWRPLDLLFGLPKLIAYLSTRSPDAVISTANNTSLVTALAVRLSRLKNCALALKTTNPIATSRHRGVARRIRLASYRWIFRWSDAVWTLSPDESTEMRAEFPSHAKLFRDVANPYVTPSMLALPAAAPRPSVGKTVISVARLTEQKRLDRLLRAFAIVRHLDTRLLILGEGEDRVALAKLADRLGIGDRVAMPGYDHDVARALHAADLFVLPSDYEGLPAVVLEAMAANCPVLVTDCFPGARSLIGQAEGCAIIEDAAASPLAAQIDGHLLRSRPTALRRLAEKYSIENGIRSHTRALREILSS